MAVTSVTAAPPVVAAKTTAAKPPADTGKSTAAAATNASGAKAPAAANVTNAKPLTGEAALLAARARYLKTGIDKDAAVGDPDHDASRGSGNQPNANSTRVKTVA